MENITFWDIKSAANKVYDLSLQTSFESTKVLSLKDNKMNVNRKNVVLQLTPLEIKIHEATSNDKWGSSTTAMKDIAQRTFD